MSGGNELNRESAFKRTQARYKRRGNDDPKDIAGDYFSDIIDFGHGQDDRILKLHLPEAMEEDSSVKLYRGPVYGVKGFPGLLFAPQALSESLQLQVAFDAVSKYCEKPHRTNIDLCAPKNNEEFNENENMWEVWKQENCCVTSTTNNKKQKTNHPSLQKRKYRSFKKLSWATLGYHYNWTERSYKQEDKSPMPDILKELSVIFASTLSKILGHESKNVSQLFAPTASIVNFYNTKSIMGGHKDDLELAIDKPIISISTGLAAVFLLGGKTKEEEPVVPILIRPGDVICMGGDTRLNYHGMARLFPSGVDLPLLDDALCPSDDDKISLECLWTKTESTIPQNDMNALKQYLSTHRININVRQVYADEPQMP